MLHKNKKEDNRIKKKIKQTQKESTGPKATNNKDSSTFKRKIDSYYNEDMSQELNVNNKRCRRDDLDVNEDNSDEATITNTETTTTNVEEMENVIENTKNQQNRNYMDKELNDVKMSENDL